MPHKVISRPRWIGIAGPTACGKTAAALAVAQVRSVEIVSVDSALVYRGMDIGTAKPSAIEQATVVHHLIDIRDPGEHYNAAAFVTDATRLIGEIHARGKLPLLVGGTMLYFKALLNGIDPMPAADPAVRAMLNAEATATGWPAMHARLAEVDPPTAARLSPNDSQRIQRALEVWHASGQPLSSFHITKVTPASADHDCAALFRWSQSNAAGCTNALPGASMRCSTPASSMKCATCAHAATCCPTCRRCVASAIDRPGNSSMPAIRALPLLPICASAVSPPPASLPSGRSPGCAACPSAAS